MELEYRKGKLLEQADVTIFALVNNCFAEWEDPIAADFKAKYPEAYEADKNSAPAGNGDKLGQFLPTQCGDGKIVVSLFAQYNHGDDKRYLDYDCLALCLEGFARSLKEAFAKNSRTHVVGFSKDTGKSGGGRWTIIKAMIEEFFLDSPHQVVIVEEINNKNNE